MGKSIWANWKRGKVVQRGMDARICVRKWKRKVSLGLRIEFAKNRNFKETRPAIWGQREDKDLGLRGGIPTASKYWSET